MMQHINVILTPDFFYFRSILYCEKITFLTQPSENGFDFNPTPQSCLTSRSFMRRLASLTSVLCALCSVPSLRYCFGWQS